LKDVGSGAYVDFNLTVDGSSSIRYPFPLCGTYRLDIWQDFRGEEPGRSCPPRKGFAEISYTTYTPSYDSHQGNWTSHADFRTSDGRRLFCLEGWVMWPPANDTEFE